MYLHEAVFGVNFKSGKALPEMTQFTIQLPQLFCCLLYYLIITLIDSWGWEQINLIKKGTNKVYRGSWIWK